MTPDTKDLATRWIEYHSEYLRTGQFPKFRSPDGSDLVRTDPDVAWNLIRDVLSLIEAKPENPLFQVLAAGPLENLLCDHGAIVIERIETLAHQDPSFNLLLGGVWSGGMSPDVWSRVEKCRVSAW